MTSIATGSGSYPSPFGGVQNAIARDTAAGSISATDATALTSALGDISAQLAAGTTTAASSTATTGTTTPTSMKDRVDSMIDDEVSSGKLTSDQATELKGAFQQAQAHMHGAHGHHHGGGGESMLAALTGTSDTSTDGQTDTTTSSTTTTGTTGSLTSAATTAMGALESFISQFQSAVNSNGLYGASGTGSSSNATSLLINAIG